MSTIPTESDRLGRPGLIVDPDDVRWVCTSCGLREHRFLIDAALLQESLGQFLSPPAIMTAECPECGWQNHFIDLETSDKTP